MSIRMAGLAAALALAGSGLDDRPRRNHGPRSLTPEEAKQRREKREKRKAQKQARKKARR